MKNLLTKDDIQKEIKLIDYAIHKEGITTRYTILGKEKNLIANVEQSIYLLKKVGFIEDYHCENGNPIILCKYYADGFDLEGNLQMIPYKEQFTWDEYVKYNEISQYWALQISIIHELDINHSIAATVWDEVPDLLKRIARYKNRAISLNIA